MPLLDEVGGDRLRLLQVDGRRTVADQLREKFPKLAVLMDDAESDVLAFMSFPKSHRVQIHSTNPLERLNAEIKRRTNVVGIFPNEPAITRLVGALPNGLNVLQAAAVEDFLFFITVDCVEPSYHKTQLWMSDGTLGGTRMIFDTPGWDPAAGLKSLATLTPVGDRLFFQAPTVVNQNGYNDGLELFAVQVPEPAGFTVVGIVAAIMGRRRHCGDASRASRRGRLLE